MAPARGRRGKRVAHTVALGLGVPHQDNESWFDHGWSMAGARARPGRVVVSVDCVVGSSRSDMWKAEAEKATGRVFGGRDRRASVDPEEVPRLNMDAQDAGQREANADLFVLPGVARRRVSAYACVLDMRLRDI